MDYEERFERIPEILNGLSERFSIPVIVSTHPRARKKIESSNLNFDKNILYPTHLVLQIIVTCKLILGAFFLIAERSQKKALF